MQTLPTQQQLQRASPQQQQQQPAPLSPPTQSVTSTKSTRLADTHHAKTTTGPVNEHLLSHIRVGDELEIWWPLDRQYYRGTIAAALSEGYHRVEYDDGDVERLYLPAEQWRFCGAAAERVTSALGLAKRVAAVAQRRKVVVVGATAGKESGPIVKRGLGSAARNASR